MMYIDTFYHSHKTIKIFTLKQYTELNIQHNIAITYKLKLKLHIV